MKIATHNGSFHTDDVFAIAMLKDLFPAAEVIRSSDEAILAKADIIVDVGKIFDPKNKRFDHHQRRAGARSNGILYSGFGLVWQEYGLAFCDNNHQVWQQIDRVFVQHIDAHDNGQKTYQVDNTGVEPYLIEDVIRLYNPSPLDNAEQGTHDQRFTQAVTFAQTILRRLKKVYLETAQATTLVLEAYKAAPDRRYILLDKHLPYKQSLQEMPELLYVVYPYEGGGSWMVEAVVKQVGSFELRKPLPTAWRGLDIAHLREVTGVQDATFCHNTGFVAGAVTKAGVLSLLEKSLDA